MNDLDRILLNQAAIMNALSVIIVKVDKGPQSPESAAALQEMAKDSFEYAKRNDKNGDA